jgi:Mg-chelatase subunit ChlD
MDSRVPSTSTLANQRGNFFVMASLTLTMVIGFVVLGIEVGRWYVVRAELSKSVDAIALLSAQHLSNPHLSVPVLVQEMGRANFQPGFLGTDGPAVFAEEVQSDGTIMVTGQTSVVNMMASVLETPKNKGAYKRQTVGSLGVAQQQPVEIVLILDRSASMSSTFNPLNPWSRFSQPPIEDLKTAALNFLEFFTATQESDQMALITFGTHVNVNVPMGSHFIGPMSDVIYEMEANGSTNTEDALAQASGPGGFSEYLIESSEPRAQQYVILFSDGSPTAFRARDAYPFKRDGYTIDNAVVTNRSSDTATLFDSDTGESLGVRQYQMGDGLPIGGTQCVTGSPPVEYLTTKWGTLEDPVYGIQSYEPMAEVDPEACPGVAPAMLGSYVQQTARQMALDRAQDLKNQGVRIYIVGLGAIDQAFLSEIASGIDFEFYTSDPSGLTQIFQQIATNIKLRLVR